MNTTPPPSSPLPTARRAPAWIALVTTALCALGAVLWISTRPARSTEAEPAAKSAPRTDPALAEARAARTTAMRERMERMQARIARLDKREHLTKPGEPVTRSPTTRPSTPDRKPTPRVVIDPACLRDPLCKQGR